MGRVSDVAGPESVNKDINLTLDLAVWSDEVPEWPTPPVRYAVGLLSATQFEDLISSPFRRIRSRPRIASRHV